MADIEVYGFEDSEGEVEGTMTDINEARQHAYKNSLKLIAYLYEYTDSEMIADYTEKVCDVCDEPIEEIANGWTHSDDPDLNDDHEPQRSLDNFGSAV